MIDLTPALPDGRNGGIGTLVETLLVEFARREVATRTTLICDPHTAGRFRELTSGRMTIFIRDYATLRRELRLSPFVGRVRRRLPCIPDAIFDRSASAVASAHAMWSRRRPRRRTDSAPPAGDPVESVPGSTVLCRDERRFADGVLRRLEADVVFSPFGSDTFAAGSTPFVPVVVDLQPFDLPEHFPDGAARRQALSSAVGHARLVVAISEFTRRRVLNVFGGDPAVVRTIPIAVPDDIAGPAEVDPSRDASTLRRLGLDRDGYWLFPANFWSHKNHAMLLEAFAMYRGRSRRPARLVFTGCDTGRGAAVRARADGLGLHDDVVFIGYVTRAELDSLYRGCRAVVFPSLYEGFGIPLVEAFAAGRPVLCADAGSLPEVAGDAAVLFDPRDPASITTAMIAFDHNGVDARDLIERGRGRLRASADAAAMADSYEALLTEAACPAVAGPARDPVAA
ncbi:MAG: glycosyltransferase family 1 protein [Planctomycetota bacterium]